jgi:hypothetical protein
MKLRDATLAVLLAGLGVASVQAGESDSLVSHETRGRSSVRAGLNLRRGEAERRSLRRFRLPVMSAAMAQGHPVASRPASYFASQLPSRWQRHLADVQPPAADI